MLLKQDDDSTLFLPELFRSDYASGLVIFVVTALIAPVAQAQTSANETSMDEVVVTATQNPVPESMNSSSVTIISEDEIEQKQAVRVAELLRSVPGVSLSRSGSLGGQTSVRVRGIDSKYTQVLVNGVRVNDPTSPDGAYDFSTMNTENIERIEIVRGNQSVLHGSDAIGGVINVITKEGTEEIQTQATAEGGSFGTSRLSTEVSGTVQSVRFSTSLSRYVTDGISAAASGTEEDGYENETLSTRLSVPISPNWTLSSFLRITDAFTETDGLDPVTFRPVDADNSQDINESVGSVELKTSDEAALQHSLRAAWFDQIRRENSQDYEGDRDRLEYDVSYEFNRNHALSGTARYENEGAEITSGLDNEFETLSAAGEYQYSPGNWLNTVGVRGLDHDEFGSHTTGRLTTAYFTGILADLLGGNETKLRASYGTGFNAPTNYQLYNNTLFVVGNPNLDPETSQGGDLGFEHYLNETDRFSLTYFRNEIEDQIGYRSGNPAGEPDYYNRNGTTETAGFESSLHVEPIERVTLDLTYTHQSSEDPSGNDIDRIPENKASGTLQWDPTESLNLGLNAEYNDERPDGGVTLEEYTLVNTTARYTIESGSSAFVRLENAFDEEYQEVDGFGTAGRAAYGGITLKF